jgi:hypothetical protein
MIFFDVQSTFAQLVNNPKTKEIDRETLHSVAQIFIDMDCKTENIENKLQDLKVTPENLTKIKDNLRIYELSHQKLIYNHLTKNRNRDEESYSHGDGSDGYDNC